MGLGFIILLILIAVIFVGLESVFDSGGSIIMMGFILSMALLVLTGFSDFDSTPIEDSKIESEILALKDNIVSEGSFFLGTGNVNGEPYYYYMREVEMGQRMERVLVSESYIKEVDTKSPSIEIYDTRFDSGYTRWAFGELSDRKRYVFNVPKGTVTTDFVVDME